MSLILQQLKSIQESAYSPEWKSKVLLNTLIVYFAKQEELEQNPCKVVPISTDCPKFTSGDCKYFSIYSGINWIPSYDGNTRKCMSFSKGNERLSVGDYVEADNGMKGVITRFEQACDNIFVYTTWSDVGMNIDSWKKVPGKEVWFHKPTDSKFILIRKPVTTTYLQQRSGIMGDFPTAFLENSQDWVKL